VAGRWFSHGTLVTSTNTTDGHDQAEILLKVALNTINLNTPKSYSTFLNGRGMYDQYTDHGQATGNLYHLRLRVGCTLFVIYKAGLEPTPY
jgi:hypothetical protein